LIQSIPPLQPTLWYIVKHLLDQTLIVMWSKTQQVKCTFMWCMCSVIRWLGYKPIISIMPLTQVVEFLYLNISDGMIHYVIMTAQSFFLLGAAYASLQFASAWSPSCSGRIVCSIMLTPMKFEGGVLHPAACSHLSY